MKEFSVPEEIVLLMNKSEAALELRDKYVKMPFSYKRALRAATDSVMFDRLFWKKIRELYPELEGSLEFDPGKNTVFEREGE
jgi:hypothetical protein